jgi:PAS domain S-box-containing protein
MDTNLRPTGIAELGDMSWGTHFCLFYETKEDLLDFFIPFFKAGLIHREFCLCVASEPLIAKDAERAMRQAIPGFDRYIADGQIEITPHTNWYLRDGYFDEQRVLQDWNDKLNYALSKGFSGVRFAANILLEKHHWESFARYEGKLEEALRDLQIEGLCAYDLNRYCAANVLDILRHHQFTLARRDGSWEPLEGFNLKHAHEEVLKLNTGLEQRVRERTASLTSVNEQLRAEIEERMRVEEALRESEEKFSAAFRASPIGLVIATTDGKYVEVNQALCDLLGYSRDELIGRTAVEIGVLTAETREEWVKALERDGNTIIHRELSFQLPNGISRTTLSSVEMITLHGVPHRLSTVLDITERKRVEEALRRSERNFRILADKSLQGISIFQDQKIVYANPAQSALLGYTEDELKAMSFDEIIALTHPLDRPTAMERVRERLSGAQLSQFIEIRILRKDGDSRWIQSFNSQIEYNGKPAVLTATIDITERKEAEEAIRKSEQVLREAEILGHTGSWEQNLVTGEIFNTEENLRLFFGDDQGKGVDLEDYAEVVHPDDRDYVMQSRVQLLAEGGPRDIEYRVVWPDGSVHVIFGRATVIYDEAGQALRVYGTNVDITERKQAEEEMRRYAMRMEALAQISRTFVEVGLDYQSVLNTVAQRTAELIGDSCVITLFSDDNRRAFPVAFHHPDPKALALMEESLLNIWRGGTDTERFQMLLAGESIYFPVVDPEQYRAQSEPEFWHYLDTVGVSSLLIVPLKAQGRVIGTLGITRDSQRDPYTRDDQILLQNIADRATMSIQNAQLFKQVEGAREQLGALSRRLLEVQEVERRAITMELHDRVGQNLTGLSINLQNMKALLSGKSAKVLSEKFDDAQTLLEEITRQIRDLMAELHLPELEDYGLAVALETYAERAVSRGNLELIADLPDLAPPRLPSEFRIALFRAAQEAISNVLKHASATQLQISLEQLDGMVRLMIEDNGRGFDPEAAAQQNSQTWGLKIMRERIESIGGMVLIESKPEKGTRVTFEIERPS